MSSLSPKFRFFVRLVKLAICLCCAPMRVQAGPSPFTTGYWYDDAGRITAEVNADPDGDGPLRYLATRNTYDAVGRLITIEQGQISSWPSDNAVPSSWTDFSIVDIKHMEYDGFNRKTVDSHEGSGVFSSKIQYSYNVYKLIECTAVRMNPDVFDSLPSACAASTEGKQGSDRITRQYYDAEQHRIQTRKAVGTTVEAADVTYSYTPSGKQKDVIDANGNHAEYGYDDYDRLSNWTFPSKTKPTNFNSSTADLALSTAGSTNIDDYEAYAYDANDNRKTLKKRDGSTINFSYDELNRVKIKSVNPASGSIVPVANLRPIYYGYDLSGHMLTARFDSITGEGVINTFNGFDEQTSSSLIMDNVGYTVAYCYYADGNRTRVSSADSSIGNFSAALGGYDCSAAWTNYAAYAYDGLDRPLSITRSGAATLASYSYDAAGRRIGFTSGGLTTSYSYDAPSRLASLGNTLAGASGYNLTIGGDGTCRDTSGNAAVCYNLAGQIIKIMKSNNYFVFNGTYNVSRDYTANGLNQYVTAGSAGFNYDNNGNLIDDGSTSFLYDVENRLVNANGLKKARLRYDPLGRLYEIQSLSGITRFVYDGDAMVAEYDGGGNLLRRYVHGADLKADDPIAWYEGSAFDGSNERLLRPDWEGSIVLAADSSGSTVFAANTYDEYGIPGGNNAGRFQYTGQAWEPELGMYYYKARFYSPTLGRFMQTDPIGYKDQINLYAYVQNDPMDRVDSTGNQSVPMIGSSNDTDSQIRAACQGSLGCEQQLRREFAETAATIIGGEVAGFGLAKAIGWVGRVIGIGEKAAPAVTIDSGQFGKKAVSHMAEFGLDVSKAADRKTFQETIQSITSKPDKVVSGTFAGQGANGGRGAVNFYIKGSDVVVAKPSGSFVTILKNGVENPSVKASLPK